MNYFDIFRIAYDDLAIMAENPEAIVTSVKKRDQGYVGEIALTHDDPGREGRVLFSHETEFSSVEEAYADLDQIIEVISVAFRNTKTSEAKATESKP